MQDNNEAGKIIVNGRSAVNHGDKMQVKEPVRPACIEPRWPVIIAILAVLLMLTMFSTRIRILPPWFQYAIGIALLLPVGGVWLSSGNPRWLSIERPATLVFSMVAEAFILTALFYVVNNMLARPEGFSGRQLLTSSIGGWCSNILAFSIVFWQIDRGGPEARANNMGTRPDWLFPQTGAPEEAPPGWRPKYVDYLYLSFSTATAFSTTDVMPLTSRAKMFMMIESAISLLTLVIVAARAINILGP
jgi:hypothetical protein